ncbi:MAG: undecaprenyl/decaprenyl-phosphate alpha-N-acetylglucosaminyl 1-phosphate transferase [Armatimonadetes bacterium]|nr:undecaprenyl/decaprenyl-phosphate alpha-N-acetylglucosaminyl 1-phosphate transferase [Armatimonadota bacterium]
MNLWQALAGFRAPMATAFVAFITTIAVTPWVIQFAKDKGAMDDPTKDERRVHTQPIPRWGGLAVFPGFLAAVVVSLSFAWPKGSFPMYLIGMVVCAAVLLAIGMVDDVKQLSAKVQLLYLLAAGVVVQLFADALGHVQVQGISLPGQGWVAFPLWVAVPFTAVYIFVVTKTMDTIDGVDGLASGIAAIAAATIVTLAVFGQQRWVALSAAAVGGACLGFLRYNYNPARIFLAGGAQVVGFLLACLSVVAALKTAATLSMLLPILIFSVPLFDAFFVVTRRIMHKQPISQADKRHVHHTLLSKGFSQKQTVWILYLVAMAVSGTLLVLVRSRG